MLDVDQVEREAIELAKRHYAVDVGLTDIFIIKDRSNGNGEADDDGERGQGAPIRLLEVNENTIPAGISPLRFGPAPASGIHFSSVIVEVTPEEFERIQKQELRLPSGWELGERVPKS